jgi:hypothetical protein
VHHLRPRRDPGNLDATSAAAPAMIAVASLVPFPLR